MIQAINFNFNKRSTLQNKGVCDAIAVSNSLMDESKKVEKKLANYLVVPNNFIPSLRAGLTNFLISLRTRARLAVYNPCKQRIFRNSLCFFCVSLCKLNF